MKVSSYRKVTVEVETGHRTQAAVIWESTTPNTVGIKQGSGGFVVLQKENIPNLIEALQLLQKEQA